MGDKIIRITSQQGFADQWICGANTTVPRNLNLCDFTIPRGYVIDMSQSYIAFNTEIVDELGEVVNASLALKTNGDELYNVPNAALVRNCAISCSQAGQLESIRRNDTLACGIWGLSHTAEEKKGDMNALTAFNGSAGNGVYTSFNLDRVSNNVSPDGGTTLLGLNGNPVTSTNISRDVKIPMKDIFGVGVVQDWDTSKWGETRIHLETNFDKLIAKQWGGTESTTFGFNETDFQGAIVAPGAAIAGAASAPLLIELDHPYGEWEYTCPFYVGQSVQISGTASAGASPADVDAKIVNIQFQLDNSSNPITGDQNKVYITLNQTYYTNPTANPTTLTDVVMKAKLVENLLVTVNRAELVLFTKEGGNTSNAYEYTTYSTEEDNGNAIVNFNRGYMLEPEAENVFIAMCNDSQILPNRDVESYRFALDNDEQTGNRDIPIAHGAVLGSSLQLERLTRCLDKSAQIPFRNAQLQFQKQTASQEAGYDTPISMICETVEVSQKSKMLNLNINCAAGLAQILIYKQLPKKISV